MTNLQFQRGAIDAGACFSDAWEQIKQRYWLYLGATLLGFVLSYYLYCISWIMFGPIMAGLYLIALKDMRGERIEFGMMFEGFNKFVPLMVVGLIQSIPQIIGQIIGLMANFAQVAMLGMGDPDRDFYQSREPDLSFLGAFMGIILLVMAVMIVFSIIWYVVFFFAIPIALENDISPTEAIGLSAKAGMANIGGIIVFLIFQCLIGLLGMLLLCVGLIFISIPVTMIASAFAYRQVFPYFGGMTTNYNPPPPNAYGFQGGGEYR